MFSGEKIVGERAEAMVEMKKELAEVVGDHSDKWNGSERMNMCAGVLLPMAIAVIRMGTADKERFLTYAGDCWDHAVNENRESDLNAAP